jgi:hypothetical protein
MFKPRFARRSLERYRKRGLDRLERRMVAAASSAGLQGERVLEIGGGIGAIQAALLDEGADRGEIVEIVAAYEPYARELAREKGLEGRTLFRVVDLLEQADEVAPADVVVLNRVVCCSPDGVALTGEAARHTRRALVLSFPRDVFWVRPLFWTVNVGMWLLRRSFRTFLHPPATLIAAAESEGLRLTGGGHGLVWEYAALTRT